MPSGAVVDANVEPWAECSRRRGQRSVPAVFVHLWDVWGVVRAGVCTGWGSVEGI
jgi:hypothetical protein